MYFESSSDGFIFVHKKQKVHSVDAKKTIVKKVKNIVHLILTFKIEKFGRRCGTQEYMRFGALLSQNLRKGTKGLNDLLRLEAIQSFEERKARARRLGEEAGTKLLLPMFLMLAEVLVIVVVPAFFTVQM